MCYTCRRAHAHRTRIGACDPMLWPYVSFFFGPQALLLDAWRLIRKMTNHKGSLRPSVDDVLHILANEGLLDPEQRCKMLKSVSRKFMNRKRKYRLNLVGFRLVTWTPEGSGPFPWRNDDDWYAESYAHLSQQNLDNNASLRSHYTWPRGCDSATTHSHVTLGRTTHQHPPSTGPGVGSSTSTSKTHFTHSLTHSFL